MTTDFDSFRAEQVPAASPKDGKNRKRNGMIAAAVCVSLFAGLGVWGTTWYFDKQKKDALGPALTTLSKSLHYDSGVAVKTTSGKSVKFGQFFDFHEDLKYKHEVYYSETAINGTTATAVLRHRLTDGKNPALDYTSPVELDWVGGKWLPRPSAASVLPFGLTEGKVVGKVIKVKGTLHGPEGELKSTGNIELANKLREGELKNKLRAIKVVQIFAADSSGKRVKTIAGPEDINPETMKVSLSDKHYKGALDALRHSTNHAAIVSVNVQNGHVLTLSHNGSSRVPRHGRYAPGSTFKAVTALALIRSGMTPDTIVECPPDIMVHGRKFKNYDAYPAQFTGNVKLKDAFAQSCNTAFIRHGMRIKWSEVHKAARDLGMLGPNAALYDDARVPEEITDPTERAASLIGQGLVVATPASMAAVAATIKKGQTVVPNMRLWEAPPAAQGKITEAEAAALRTMMEHTVTSGTGEKLRELGPGTGAKTGTSQHGLDRPEDAWMIGYHGDVAVAVYIAGGGSGSAAAGPMAKHYFLATR